MPALRQRFTRLIVSRRFLKRLPALALVAGALLVPSTALAASRVKVHVTSPTRTLVAKKTVHFTVKATYGGHATTGKAYYRFYITHLGFETKPVTQKLKNGKTVFAIKATESDAEQAVELGKGLHFYIYFTAKTPHGTVTSKVPVKFKLK